MKTLTKPGRIGASLKFAATILFLIDTAGATALASASTAPTVAANGNPAVFWVAVASLVLSLFCAIVIGLILFQRIPQLAGVIDSIVNDINSGKDNVLAELEKINQNVSRQRITSETLNPLSSQLNGQISNAVSSMKNEIDEKLQAFAQLRPELNQIVGSLKHDVQEVQGVLACCDSHLKDRITDHERRETEFQNRQAELLRIEQGFERREADAKREKAELESRERAIVEARAVSDRELKQAASERTEASRIREESQKEREATETRIRELQEHRAAFERSVDAFWPAPFLKGGRLANERPALEQRIADSKSLAALLVNNLQRVYLMASAAGLYEPQEIARAVQEMSRVAYRYWAETDRDGDSQYRESKLWADVFQELLGPDFKLYVVRIGESRDPSIMQYTEGPSSVTKVQTWYVECSSARLRAHVA